MSKFAVLFALVGSAIFGAGATTAQVVDPPVYTLTKSIPLGAPDHWDYVVVDRDTGRVYVAHGDRVAVVDGRAGTMIGEVVGIVGGTHGTGISTSTGQGFTDDGRNGLAVAYDLKTLKITKQIVADKDADSIAVDKATGHIFIIEGDPGAITVIDPKSNTVVATIKAGEKMEYGAADGQGTIYVAGNEKKDLLKIDARTNTITARWPTPGCTSPHGLAYDPAGKRLFMGCINSKLMVVDATSGTVVAELPIGRGSDAVAFDAKRRRVFSSNGVDGTITVFQQTAPDSYEALQPVVSAVSGRTMDVDPSTGRLFVAAAATEPSPTPGGRPRPLPGTLRLMIFDPVK
jgi:DNA-binding beta-propeller fold protein YncE